MGELPSRVYYSVTYYPFSATLSSPASRERKLDRCLTLWTSD
jgi:hypothetical protein